jgi:hypothetical protein
MRKSQTGIVKIGFWSESKGKIRGNGIPTGIPQQGKRVPAIRGNRNKRNERYTAYGEWKKGF